MGFEFALSSPTKKEKAMLSIAVSPFLPVVLAFSGFITLMAVQGAVAVKHSLASRSVVGIR